MKQHEIKDEYSRPTISQLKDVYREGKTNPNNVRLADEALFTINSSLIGCDWVDKSKSTFNRYLTRKLGDINDPSLIQEQGLIEKLFRVKPELNNPKEITSKAMILLSSPQSGSIEVDVFPSQGYLVNDNIYSKIKSEKEYSDSENLNKPCIIQARIHKSTNKIQLMDTNGLVVLDRDKSRLLLSDSEDTKSIPLNVRSILVKYCGYIDMLRHDRQGATESLHNDYQSIIDSMFYSNAKYLQVISDAVTVEKADQYLNNEDKTGNKTTIKEIIEDQMKSRKVVRPEFTWEEVGGLTLCKSNVYDKDEDTKSESVKIEEVPVLPIVPLDILNDYLIQEMVDLSEEFTTITKLGKKLQMCSLPTYFTTVELLSHLGYYIESPLISDTMKENAKIIYQWYTLHYDDFNRFEKYIQKGKEILEINSKVLLKEYKENYMTIESRIDNILYEIPNLLAPKLQDTYLRPLTDESKELSKEERELLESINELSQGED